LNIYTVKFIKCLAKCLNDIYKNKPAEREKIRFFKKFKLDLLLELIIFNNKKRVKFY